MNEKYFPFNSVNGDRKFKAEDWTNYFKQTLTTGVFPSPAMGLKVVSNNNMTLIVNAGSANIEGYFYTLFENKTIKIEPAGATLRTDLIVLRWSKLNRNISIEVLKNTNSRLWNEEFKDLILARVTIRPLTDSILDADILDTRLSSDCGIVNSLMQADTEEIFQQYESWFNYNKDYYNTHIQNWTGVKQHEFESWTTEQQNNFNSWTDERKAEFLTWLEDMRNILDGDAVGNILNKINANTEKISETKKDLSNMHVETSEKFNHYDTQTALAINSIKSFNEYGLKYLLRPDAEISIHRTESLTTKKTITIPDDKLAYLIKGYVKHYYSNGTIYGFIKIVDSNNSESTLADSQRLTKNTGLYFRNILFSREDYFYTKPNIDMVFESSSLEFITVLPNTLKKLEIQNSEVTLLLLDKDKGGIDYNGFNQK